MGEVQSNAFSVVPEYRVCVRADKPHVCRCGHWTAAQSRCQRVSHCVNWEVQHGTVAPLISLRKECLSLPTLKAAAVPTFA
eukprot:m.49801 g.49801  ORF g.49801 m.49801 type:complete len:81 (+) comp16203_c1_seq1:1579-1821(+)